MFRPFMVVDFGANRKRVSVYDFLLARYSKLSPILHCFGDIAGFYAPGWPYPYSTLIVGVFPLHQITHVGVSPSRGLKLFGREITFEEFQPMWYDTYMSHTDRQMDNILWHNHALHSIAQ